MIAGTVLKLVSGALQDLEPDVAQRWSHEEDGRASLLDFLNAAVRAIALQRPDALAVTEVIQLEPGMRQALPCPKKHRCRHKATMLLDVIRNMGSGECPGRAIVSVNMDVLLAWACTMAESPVIDNWAYDRTVNPDFYMVYPAVPENVDVCVEATFAVAPGEIKSPEACIGLPEEYERALFHHMLASILMGDSASSDSSKGYYHVQMFNSLMGIKTRVDMGWPKAKASAVPGGAA